MQVNNNYTPYKNSPSFGSASSFIEKAANVSSKQFGKMIEFDSFNMSFPVMAAIMAGGVVVPRIIQAQDSYDKGEIIRRDAITIATLIMGAPALSKLFSKMNENKSGFVLADKSAEQGETNIFKKLKHYFIPSEGRQVYKSHEIVSKYSDLKQYNQGILGFCDFIENGKGNLAKIFSSSETTDGIMQTIAGEGYKNADNKTIRESLAKALGDVKFKDAMDNLYKAFENNKANVFVKKAKSMNSSFNFLATFFLVPLILGFGIPKMNDLIIRKEFKEKKEAEKKAKQTQPQASPEHFNNPYFMSAAIDKSKKSNKVFDSFKKD